MWEITLPFLNSSWYFIFFEVILHSRPENGRVCYLGADTFLGGFVLRWGSNRRGRNQFTAASKKGDLKSPFLLFGHLVDANLVLLHHIQKFIAGRDYRGGIVIVLLFPVQLPRFFIHELNVFFYHVNDFPIVKELRG